MELRIGDRSYSSFKYGECVQQQTPSVDDCFWGSKTIKSLRNKGSKIIKSSTKWGRDNYQFIINKYRKKYKRIDHPKPAAAAAAAAAAKKVKILDPQKRFVQKLNRIFVILCIIGLSLDPIFFYIPYVDGEHLCVGLDKGLAITTCVLRSFIDFFHLFHIALQFRTGFIAPSSRVLGRGELVVDPTAMAKRYLSSYFIVDVLSILPLPQVAILDVLPRLKRVMIIYSMDAKDIVKCIVFAQYVPRVWRIVPLYKEVTRTSGIIFAETAWGGAAFNLYLYLIASHTIGATWYMMGIERKDECWRRACRSSINCNLKDLYCNAPNRANTSFLTSSCPLLDPTQLNTTKDFDFGIFIDLHQSHIAQNNNTPQKILYCLWWGLRSLSSLGQNLRTSTFVGEILFADFIAVIGLFFFALFIGNMQKYLQSMMVRVEEMRLKRRDSEQWMAHHMLPESLRRRIRRYDQYKWQETRGVEEYSLINNLPRDLQRETKRHLCWDLISKVPLFEHMDEKLLDAICRYLKPVLFTQSSSIVREGDPVEGMHFIMRGTIKTETTDGDRKDYYNSLLLEAGDFCGDELLTWALDPKSSPTLPMSTRTVTVEIDVEAFCIMPDDLKTVMAQYRCFNRKKLQHVFRNLSPQFKTWAARFIQAAWHQYKERKSQRALQMLELNSNPNALLSSLSWSLSSSSSSTRLLQKPAEPDFNPRI